MSKTTELKAQPRADTGKEAARKLRAGGRIPAVMYGKDMEARGLSLDLQETQYLFERISVENTILDLVIEGDDEPVRTLIREIQSYPHKPGLLHVDFLRIQKGVAVEVEIPISLEGVPIGVREAGGILETIINEIRVKCIPSKIPEVVSLDVTDLAVGDSLHVSDIDLGEDVDILVEADRTVCSVQIPKVVEVEEEVSEEELEEGLEDVEGEAEAEAASEDEASAGEEG
ncbi:MAG: 50S ribosomal protein L25 [Gemmatimonadetes bacterium]|nr:50S ribosomal protein L25 [Gemmatimonadota bacterium]NNM06827.1 50S ribosomal protein L25 [Gemmatimonadota bacterium]